MNKPQPSTQDAHRPRRYDRNGAHRDRGFGHHQEFRSRRQRKGIGRSEGGGVGESQKQVIDESGRPIFELLAFGKAALLLREDEIAGGFEKAFRGGGAENQGPKHQSKKTTEEG